MLVGRQYDRSGWTRLVSLFVAILVRFCLSERSKCSCCSGKADFKDLRRKTHIVEEPSNQKYAFSTSCFRQSWHFSMIFQTSTQGLHIQNTSAPLHLSYTNAAEHMLLAFNNLYKVKIIGDKWRFTWQWDENKENRKMKTQILRCHNPLWSDDTMSWKYFEGMRRAIDRVEDWMVYNLLTSKRFYGAMLFAKS